MPTSKPDNEAQARKIALEVGSRRRAGEVISDEQILREHPNLHALLLEQLTRLSRLETARLRFENESKQQEIGEDSPVNEMVSAENSISAIRPDDVPTELADSTDQLRITLKEPGLEVRNQSTMILEDPVANDVEGAEPVSHQPPAEPTTPCYRPSVRAPMGIVKLFHDGQTAYNPYPIMADRFRIGRVEGDLIVPHDYWMSGRHAEIQRRKRGDQYHWYLVDLNSTNGTFVQVDFAVLRHQDEIFLGQERYRFIIQEGRAGLMHVTNNAGEQWWLDSAAAIIGSLPPCGLLCFTKDPYLDTVHARLKREPDGTWTIRDNRSRNGVWFRIKEVQIPANAEFQLGEQRFGFWTNADHPIREANLHVAAKEHE